MPTKLLEMDRRLPDGAIRLTILAREPVIFAIQLANVFIELV
jgi:hypothetical protein